MNLNCYLKVTEKYLQRGIQGENLNPMLFYSRVLSQCLRQELSIEDKYFYLPIIYNAENTVYYSRVKCNLHPVNVIEMKSKPNVRNEDHSITVES